MQQPPDQAFGNQQQPQQWEQGRYPQQSPTGPIPQGQFPPQGQPFQQQPYQGYPQQFGQPPAPAPKKKRGKGLLIVGAVLLLALFGCIGFSILRDQSGATSTTTTNTTTGSTTQSQPTGTWKTTHTFSGNGTKKTESFQVGNDWKIAWSCKGVDIGGTQADGALAISVFGSDGTPIDAASGTCKAGKTSSDVTEEHQGGTVYLDIIGDSDWTIQVQELK